MKHVIFSKIPGITATFLTLIRHQYLTKMSEGKWLFTFPSSLQNSGSYLTLTLSNDSSEEPFVNVASNVKNQLTSYVQGSVLKSFMKTIKDS